MITELAYGRGRIPVERPEGASRWDVIRPHFPPALADPENAFRETCLHPVAAPSLIEAARDHRHILITTSDGTRPVPNRLLIPWLRDLLPEKELTILLGNGTHRANTPEEIREIFGGRIADEVEILNHDAFNDSAQKHVGDTEEGAPVLVDRRWAEAEFRIAIGFIEPHFFAGFSGGMKAVFPGLAGIESIHHLHRFELIDHPEAAWGLLDGNPLQAAVQEMGGMCPPDFLINVILNGEKEITGIFAGDPVAAHREGCARVREYAIQAVPYRYPVVITTNSGYPLDQNLYQTVKGMSAAARIVAPGGSILVASECADGIPEHGLFGTFLRECGSPGEMISRLKALDAPMPDQWQVQVFARILEKAEVHLYSSLDAETARACHLHPVDNLQSALAACMLKAGGAVPVAVLPEGPLTIPELAR